LSKHHSAKYSSSILPVSIMMQAGMLRQRQVGRTDWDTAAGRASEVVPKSSSIMTSPLGRSSTAAGCCTTVPPRPPLDAAPRPRLEGLLGRWLLPALLDGSGGLLAAYTKISTRHCRFTD
jgi:hypothetical protein